MLLNLKIIAKVNRVSIFAYVSFFYHLKKLNKLNKKSKSTIIEEVTLFKISQFSKRYNT